jgi:WD40 repeat protein
MGIHQNNKNTRWVSSLAHLHNKIVSYSLDEKKGKLWDVPTGNIQHDAMQDKKNCVVECPDYIIPPVRRASILDWSAHNERAVAIDAMSGLIAWNSRLDLATAERAGLAKRIHKKSASQEAKQSNPFLSVALSPCANYIFAGCADGTVIMLDAETYEQLATFKHATNVTAVNVSHNEKNGVSTLIAGLRNGEVAVWQRDIELEQLPHDQNVRDIQQTPLDDNDQKQPLYTQDDGPEIMFMADKVPPRPAIDVCKTHCQECGRLCCDCMCIWKATCQISGLIFYDCCTNGAVCCGGLSQSCCNDRI